MKSFERLIQSIRRLPGIGPKQAERIAMHFLRANESETETLISALREVKERVRTCALCFNYSEMELCRLCADESRDRGVLCVVEEPSDVAAIERSRSFKGRYHVLHGSLSPVDGIAPDMLRVRELLERVKDPRCDFSEIIIATDHDTEGEATALYLAQILKPHSVKVTRIALGVPMGGDLDYVDERTLSSALSGRRELTS